MRDAFNQLMQFIGRGIAWVLAFVQLVWTWSSDQIVKLMETPWENWPLWRQVLLAILLVSVAYALFVVVRQLWAAVRILLYAVANFISALIVTLPAILIAGAIAFGGLWIMNNIQDHSFFRNWPL
jgi:hypothetical protein